MNLIEIKQLRSAIFDGCSWDLRENELHVIVGPSGGGKSTLLRIILGLESNYSGEILNADGKPWDIQEESIGVQFQNSALLGNLTIGENVMLPLRLQHPISFEAAYPIVLEYLEKVGLKNEDFDKFPSQCSGGMQKRAALARALILKPKILILDEPTSGLDFILTEAYIDLILKLKNMTILMVTHDIHSIEKVADRISLVTKGNIFTGKLEELRKSDNVLVREFFNYYV